MRGLARLADVDECSADVPITFSRNRQFSRCGAPRCAPLQARVTVTSAWFAVAISGLTPSARIDFLVTWKCTHIANAEMAAKIAEVCRDHGFDCPVICTPEELMGT